MLGFGTTVSSGWKIKKKAYIRSSPLCLIKQNLVFRGVGIKTDMKKGRQDDSSTLWAPLEGWWKERALLGSVDRHAPLSSSCPLCCPCHEICRSFPASYRPQVMTCWFTKVWSTHTNYRRKSVLTTSIWCARSAIICDMWNQCETIILSLRDKALLAGAGSSLNQEQLQERRGERERKRRQRKREPLGRPRETCYPRAGKAPLWNMGEQPGPSSWLKHQILATRLPESAGSSSWGRKNEEEFGGKKNLEEGVPKSVHHQGGHGDFNFKSIVIVCKRQAIISRKTSVRKWADDQTPTGFLLQRPL